MCTKKKRQMQNNKKSQRCEYSGELILGSRVVKEKYIKDYLRQKGYSITKPEFLFD